MPYTPRQSPISILCPGVPENMKLSRKMKKISQPCSFRSTEGEGFVTYSCLNDTVSVPIINGVPVVIDRH